MRWTIAVAATIFACAVYAQDIGQIKSVRGSAHVEREGKRVAAVPGMNVRGSDTLVTGADGALGVTFLDNTMVSAGPSSVLEIERYNFNSTTHAGQFDASLKKGSIAVVSGKMVKQTPGSMRVRTPTTVMGVRGTEFLVRVD
ncbi:MAG TPA: FecR domain-containing protein [Burkholderiales bacterium]|jgi:hypothetical protein